jgi:hypothetical protein
MKNLFAGILLAGLPLLAQTPAVQPPPNYDTFQPPSPGGTYTDPVFGSTVQRISNAMATSNADRGGKLQYITDEYSTASPFNLDNSKLLLVHQSYFAVYDASAAYVRDLPMEVNSSSEPRWSRAEANLIYYVRGNQLKSYDVSTSATAVVHTFSEYAAISGKGESDISIDGDHFVFAGDNKQVFVYQISANKKFATLDTGGRAFDSLYITPRNNVTVTWNQSGTARYQGIEMFDKNMGFQRQIARAGGHMDVTTDTDGEEVMIWANAGDPQPVCDNGAVKIRLSDAKQTCLVKFDWSLALHVSAPDSSGFVYVEAYAPGNPTPTSGWKPYTNELLQVKLDGSQVVRLAHFRSRPFNSYNWQPKISTSRDGSRVVYNSNYDLQAILGYPSEYSDVYMIVTGASAPSVAPPATEAPATAPAETPQATTPPATTSAATNRVEQDSPAVEKSGTWFPNAGSFNSGGSSILAMDAGSTVKFTFTGTGVKWIGFRDAWSGIAQVYVDGVLQSTVDTFSAVTLSGAELFSATGLSNATHTLTIKVTGNRSAGAAGAWVWVDAFEVTVPATARLQRRNANHPLLDRILNQRRPIV